MSQKTVAVLVGSLRKGSFSRKVALAVAAIAPSSLKCELLEIGTLPHFDQDHEGDPSKAVHDFKARIVSADAVLFVTPEYNRSVPGVLKNAIDVGSRPYGHSAWNGKPAAIISISPGPMGGFGANHHLRQSLVFLNMPTMAQPEAYLGHAENLFNDSSELAHASTSRFLKDFVAAFSAWVDHNAGRWTPRPN